MEDKEIFDLAARQIYDNFLSKKEYENKHAQDTLKYLERAYPDPPCALRIAAYGHDIERAVNNKKKNRNKMCIGQFYRKHKELHTLKSSCIILYILSELGLDRNIIHDACYIALNHEYGPKSDDVVLDSYSKSYDLNLAVKRLMNSDARAFFEEHSLEKYLTDYGRDALKQKIIFSYRRLDGVFSQEFQNMQFSNEKIEDIIKETIRFPHQSSGL
jgi:hypothetical protein